MDKCIYAHIYTHMCICVHVGAKGQPKEVGLLILRQGLSLDWVSPVGQVGGPADPPGSACLLLFLLHADGKSTGRHTCLSHGFWESELRSTCLLSKQFTN